MHSRGEIQNTVSRFMNSFDLKDWSTMEDLLAPRIRIDYDDLRGEPPSVVRAGDYVRSRKEALEPLSTQHLLALPEVEISGDTAEVRASCRIYRTRGGRSFHSHGFYVFSLTRLDGSWRISGIRQKIFWNEGEPELHGGVQ